MHILIGKSPHVNIFPMFAIIWGGFIPWLRHTRLHLSCAGDEEVRKEYWQELKETLAREDFLHPRFDFGRIMRRHCWSKDIYTVYTRSLGCIVYRTLAEDLETDIITGKEIPHGTDMNKNQPDGKNQREQEKLDKETACNMYTHMTYVWMCLYPQCVSMCLFYWEDVQSRSSTYHIKECMHTDSVCIQILFIAWLGSRNVKASI